MDRAAREYDWQAERGAGRGNTTILIVLTHRNVKAKYHLMGLPMMGHHLRCSANVVNQSCKSPVTFYLTSRPTRDSVREATGGMSLRRRRGGVLTCIAGATMIGTEGALLSRICRTNSSSWMYATIEAVAFTFTRTSSHITTAYSVNGVQEAVWPITYSTGLGVCHLVSNWNAR